MASNKNTPSDKSKNNKDIAYDKFDVDISSHRKKTSKVPKKKNPFLRFINAIFPAKGDSKGDIARKFLLLTSIVVFAGTIVVLLTQLKGMNKGSEGALNTAIQAGTVTSEDTIYEESYTEPDRLTNPSPYIPEGPGVEPPEYDDLTPDVNVQPTPDWNWLRNTNPDVRAWVKIQGTLINNVVMQDPNAQDFYLDHDMNRNESISGEIFSTSSNKWDGTDENIILFGHNMKSGYFFAYVNHYFPDDYSSEPIAFYKKHPTVMLATPDGGCETYKIFAGFIANTDPQYGEVFSYINKTNFSGKEDFNQFIRDVMDRSWFFTDVDLEYGDKLLTLSTCYWPIDRSVETRFVVMARKVRPGESEEVDTSVATRNKGAKLFEYYYQLIGTQWYGSTWDDKKYLKQ